MVREKEAFLQSLIKLIDMGVILVAFFVSYFVSFYIRDLFELGEMAFAVSQDLEGFMHFFQNTAVLLGDLHSRLCVGAVDAGNVSGYPHTPVPDHDRHHH
ncbi:MAG: hypothetical protein Q9P14_07870 [candidate division KSB1 bacterium]|nr:hypothetical protein [candidate division KSB1 bacterium]